jgi:hypothetical protein
LAEVGFRELVGQTSPRHAGIGFSSSPLAARSLGDDSIEWRSSLAAYILYTHPSIVYTSVPRILCDTILHSIITMTPALQVAFGTEGAPEREFLGKVFDILKTLRMVDIEVVNSQSNTVAVFPSPSGPIDSLAILASALAGSKRGKEAEALQIVISRCLEKIEFGGLALSQNTSLTDLDHNDILFLVGACLESLNSQEKAREPIPPLAVKSSSTRPMTLAEKIFAHHAIGGTAIEGLTAGEVARIAVDWVIASEVSWFVRFM